MDEINDIDKINIRLIGIGDLDQLQQISRRTFFEAFSATNVEENVNEYISTAFSTDKLAAEINDPFSEFYFAELHNNTIGYIKLNSGRSQTELQDENALEIERIYVVPEFQGKQVGQLLFEHAVARAREKNADYVWLGVWEQNYKAINFYTKHGFAEFNKHTFKLGAEEQTDIMMKLKLHA
jgi:ribosomal protein S18 acetylase RimI-like enzyme